MSISCLLTDSRTTTRVPTGSLWLARRIASTAEAWSTPAISNRIRPGLTTATQWSGAPLPEPIRVSAGFLVAGLSGKTRIQILPPRLTERVMARRAASIWRLVIQAGSSVIQAVLAERDRYRRPWPARTSVRA